MKKGGVKKGGVKKGKSAPSTSRKASKTGVRFRRREQKASGGTSKPKKAGDGSPAAGSPASRQRRAEPKGFAARELSVRLIHDVMVRGIMLDDALSDWSRREPFDGLEARDRGLARLIAATALRRHGQLTSVINAFIAKPLPEARGRLTAILLAAGAHLLFLEGARHAVINLAVEQCKRDAGARRFAKLANAVLRRVGEQGSALLAQEGGIASNIPGWLLKRWRQTYGDDVATAIAEGSLREAALDLTVKSAPEEWAKRLGGVLLKTGSVRLWHGGPVEDLEGYGEGAWWVQDAAAALPARLLGNLDGLEVADLGAAPGGKTAQLLASGARVTAVDGSGARLKRLKQNLERLKMNAEIVEADIMSWAPGKLFDAVLLDAPCSATGTIRRHPDLLHTKSEQDIERLAGLQADLLRQAAGLVRPGGRLVYCTCSLEAEEGEVQIARFLEAQPRPYSASRHTVRN